MMKAIHITEQPNLKIAQDLAEAIAAKKVSMTLGNFDGVHSGHQALIKKATNWSKGHSGCSVLVSFYPHPSEVLNPKATKKQIFINDVQEDLLQKLGVDLVVRIQFTQALSELTAEQFFEQYIWQLFRPSFLCVGHDFAFGKNRQGTIAWLANKTRELKIKFEIQSAVLYQDEPISSSRIRDGLQSGNMEQVRSMLGFPYYVQGTVVRGDAKGSKIGFPTANINIADSDLIENGVYVSKTFVEGTEFLSITNIGMAPTFSRDSRKIETHILDFQGDLYGQKLKIEFYHNIRKEKKFTGVQELIKQIEKDVQMAKEYFKL
jgi:riboflavin kinase/FMN adenylyltransferase